MLVHPKTNKFKHKKFNSIRVSGQGLDRELKMTKTSVKLLSVFFVGIKCDTLSINQKFIKRSLKINCDGL